MSINQLEPNNPTELLLHNRNAKESGLRWVVVSGFILASSPIGILLGSVSAIASEIRLIYNVDSGIVNIFASCFFFSALLFNFPASYIIGHKSIRLSIMIGCCTTVLGVWLKILVNYHFTFAVVGQCISAIGLSFFSNAPSQISARWFRVQNVKQKIIVQTGTPTMLMNISPLVFSSAIPIISVLVINKEPTQISSGEYAYFRSRLQFYFLYEAIYCSVASIFGVLLFKQAPSKVTNITAIVESPPIQNEIKQLAKNCSFIGSVLSIAFSLSSYNGLHLLSQQILKKYGMLSHDIALINLIYIPASIISVLLQGRIIRCFSSIKSLMMLNYIALLGLIVALQFILPTGIVPLIGATMVLQSCFLSPNIGLSQELAASLTFPVCKFQLHQLLV